MGAVESGLESAPAQAASRRATQAGGRVFVGMDCEWGDGDTPALIQMSVDGRLGGAWRGEEEWGLEGRGRDLLGSSASLPSLGVTSVPSFRARFMLLAARRYHTPTDAHSPVANIRHYL